ncbi:DNA-dependent RNA polymerase subunit rpo18 [Yokapox virus]|uniref:DNA-directed RNA polymerase 18 kDa subunit n=1 Tax=Yokapox virus TaxID=1076255 RepID=G3EIH1_9POXV|nr:DNA-dependent RNA polymerase subunit rpo18 [Yokapox virus]AEN03682.1 DNA-dependent RNA polymerase subunit rpo18 [Yokapox virus]
MSSFTVNEYLSITLDPHELTLDIKSNIKNAVYKTYLHKEIGGKMAKKIQIREDVEIPLGELVNNYIVINVPCTVTYIYYHVGDIVRGTLNIEDESNVTIQCGDLICKLSRESGTVSFSDSKYCFFRNGNAYNNGSEVSAILMEAQQGTESSFVFLANIFDS